MLKFLKSLFVRPATPTVPEAPYKLETPESTVGSVPMTTQYIQPVVEKPKKKPAAKKPAGAKKPAVKAKAAKSKKSAS